MTLTEFLLARIAEDEARAGAMAAAVADPGNTSLGSERQRSRRAVDECEAKRQIVEEHAYQVHWCATEVTDEGIHGQRIGLEFAVKHLALPYADHPDYREEWKP